MHAFVHEYLRKRNLIIGKKMSKIMCLSFTSNINIDYKLFPRSRGFHKQRKRAIDKRVTRGSKIRQNRTIAIKKKK